jgi:hypothetical protein
MFKAENAGFHNARQACYVCLQPHDGVDTEVTIDYEGVLFICKSCIKAMAETAGLTVDEDRRPEIERLNAQLADAKQAQLDAEAIVIELERSAKAMYQRRMEKVRSHKGKAQVDA